MFFLIFIRYQKKIEENMKGIHRPKLTLNRPSHIQPTIVKNENSEFPRKLPSIEKHNDRSRLLSIMTSGKENPHALRPSRTLSKDLSGNSLKKNGRPSQEEGAKKSFFGENFGMMVQSMNTACQQRFDRRQIKERITLEPPARQSLLKQVLVDFSKQFIRKGSIPQESQTRSRKGNLKIDHKVVVIRVSEAKEKKEQKICTLQPRILQYKIKTEKKEEDPKAHRRSQTKNSVPLHKIGKQEVNELKAHFMQLQDLIEEQQQDIVKLKKEEEDLKNSAIQHQTEVWMKQQELVSLKQELRIYNEKRQEMARFLDIQPNKILQQEVKSYKEVEQSLFNLANALEGTLPNNTNCPIEDHISMSKANFHSLIEAFPNDVLILEAKDAFSLTGKEISDFKTNILRSFEDCLSKGAEILQGKCLRLKEMMQLMRRLASFTLGKRQYLEQINKKVAIVQNSLDQLFDGQREKWDEREKGEFRELSEKMFLLYEQAQVFY